MHSMMVAIALTFLASPPSLNGFLIPISTMHRNLLSRHAIKRGTFALANVNSSTSPMLDGPRFRPRRQLFQFGALSATLALFPTVAPAVAAESGQSPAAADGEYVTSAAKMLLRTLPNRSIELISLQDALEVCAHLLQNEASTGATELSNSTSFNIREITDRAMKILLAERPSPAVEAPLSAWLTFFSSESRPGLAPHMRSEDNTAAVASRKQRSSTALSSVFLSLVSLNNAAIGHSSNRSLSELQDEVNHALLALGEAGAIAAPSGKAYPYRSDLETGLAKGIVPRQVPWLLGRAGIDLTFKKKFDGNAVKVSVVLDGFAAPLSSGSVLDLVQRGFYNGLSVDSNVRVESEEGSRRDWAATVMLGAQPPVDTLPRFLQPQTDKNGRFNTAPQEDATAATASSSGFVEPVTGKQRRVPLEILRTRKPGEPGVNLVYSAARNSAVFTKTQPMVSTRVPGALVLLHAPFDGNGGGSQVALFTGEKQVSSKRIGATRNDKSGDQAAFQKGFDGRFAVLGYVVAGLNDALALTDGDVLSSATVKYGFEDLLLPTKLSLVDKVRGFA